VTDSFDWDIDGHAVAPMGRADAPDWATFALLPEVQAFTSSTAESVADLVPMIERTLVDDPNAPLLFAVRTCGPDGSPGRMVASLGFHTVSALNRSAEITYTVHPECWGRGLATALARAALHWGFSRRQWVRIQATTLVDHLASQRVLAKCGFVFEGRLRNFRLVRGQPRDYLMYARVPGDPEPGETR
jgi:RimJ/RimL family protein N-acetyltransferase